MIVFWVPTGVYTAGPVEPAKPVITRPGIVMTMENHLFGIRKSVVQGGIRIDSATAQDLATRILRLLDSAPGFLHLGSSTGIP